MVERPELLEDLGVRGVVDEDALVGLLGSDELGPSARSHGRH